MLTVSGLSRTVILRALLGGTLLHGPALEIVRSFGTAALRSLVPEELLTE
ncbi:hypothetical protein [Deinococcus sonorensis]|uniref:Uncharacterized protein n=2 Tax=Deinococcus sonorensis TaxID=309891 RepID=A0AAU7U709_9DEIO